MDSGNRTMSGKRVRTTAVRNGPERHCGDGRGRVHSMPRVNPLASQDGSSRAFQQTASASASFRPLPGTACRPAPRSKGSSSTMRIHMAVLSCQCSHGSLLMAGQTLAAVQGSRRRGVWSGAASCRRPAPRLRRSTSQPARLSGSARPDRPATSRQRA